ncbi:hypothetical protein B0H11DRAFT_2225056 [Mycena galericulata]|nr:hypothetical protein B0H11DRAFT_2225056 [Mycena galericulata]
MHFNTLLTTLAAGAAAITLPEAAGATTTASAGSPPFDPAGDKNVGNGKAAQFVCGQCLSAADGATGAAPTSDEFNAWSWDRQP